MKILIRSLLILLLFPIINYSQEMTLKEQKIQEERSNLALPDLPQQDSLSLEANLTKAPASLDINSAEVVKQKRVLPNEGNPYFVFSTSLAPYQASLGILKYFIPEWWGQLEINLTFIPSIPVDDYYTAVGFFKPYVAFRIITGYSFYNYRIFEISLIAQAQFVFVSTDDIPFLPTLGMRFIFNFFYIDVGVSYAVSIGSSTALVFKGWYPSISLGFRF
ncbi:MAG: hypothetical protein ACRCWI_07300 [Brevinema sp.]